MREIVFFYVDLGNPGYELLARSMVKSAKSVMPEVHVTQLTDEKTPRVPGVDDIGRFDVGINAENLMAARTACFAKHSRHLKGPAVFCDIDCLWLRKPEFEAEPWDIGLLFRAGQPAMPYISCMVYSKANEKAIEFWSDWACTANHLPARFHGWWCDQVALSMMMGLEGKPGDRLTAKSGARVGILDAYDHAMIPTSHDQEVKAVMVHFKGVQRKNLMMEKTECPAA